MAMKRAWVIIGGKNVKKSTVIRALTGTGNASIRSNRLCQIERADGLIFSLVPYTSAMQEQEVTPQEMLDHFKKRDFFVIPKPSQKNDEQVGFNFPQVRNFLFCLHNVSKNKKFPDAIEYIKLLLTDDWNIEAIIFLGKDEPNVSGKGRPKVPDDDALIATDNDAPSWLQYSGIRYASIPNAQELPGSVVAYKVRDYFQWR
ncbi:MAG: hypothetical protein WDZ54_12170 [Sneathiella sp.]